MKRKNPYTEENSSPTKKRKLDVLCSDWCIKLRRTSNITGSEALFSINNKKTFKVGRDPSCCCVVFADTPMVSRIHCQFIYNQNNGNKLFVKDLKSTNGVFVNGEQIDKNGALKQIFNNDIIRFGKKYKTYNHEYKVEIITTNKTPNTSTNTFSNTSTNNGSLLDIQSMLQQTIAAQLSHHTKKMEEKLAAKDEEQKRLKQKLHEKEMKEMAEKAKREKQELEKRQKEVENMKKKMEKEKLKQLQILKQQKQKIEEEKENAIKEQQKIREQELLKMKQKEQETKQKEIEAQQKIKEIEAAQKKLEEEKFKQEEEMKKHKKKMEEEEAKIAEKEKTLKENELKLEELNNNADGDAIEEETTCCMCYDILLKAHSLECGHTMCHQCIREWIDENKPSAKCPICRADVKNDPTPCRVLDNIIESIHIKNQSEEAKNEWNQRKQEYQTWKTAYDAAQNNNNNRNNNNNVWGGNNNGFNWAQWGNNNGNNNNNNNNNNNDGIMEIDDESSEEEEEESDWEQSITYSVEYARSGRSTCRGCWRRIDNSSLRFGVQTAADPDHGQYYDTTHWYHPSCFGTKFKNTREAQERRNIENNAGLSSRALTDKLNEIFESDDDSSSDSDSEDDVPVNRRRNNNNNNNGRIGGRKMQIDGINYRARVNRLESLTVHQLKRYCQENGVYVPSSMRKAALCAMIRRDITTAIG